jgi:hypothetical protein
MGDLVRKDEAANEAARIAAKPVHWQAGSRLCCSAAWLDVIVTILAVQLQHAVAL